MIVPKTLKHKQRLSGMSRLSLLFRLSRSVSVFIKNSCDACTIASSDIYNKVDERKMYHSTRGDMNSHEPNLLRHRASIARSHSRNSVKLSHSGNYGFLVAFLVGLTLFSCAQSIRNQRAQSHSIIKKKICLQIIESGWKLQIVAHARLRQFFLFFQKKICL